MSKSLSTITRGIAALALSVAGLAVFAGVASAVTAAAPTNVTATDTLGTGTITVAWTDGTNADGVVTGYTVNTAANGTGTTVCSVTGGPVGGVNTCSFAGSSALAGAKLYVIAVIPTGAGAPGEPSAAAANSDTALSAPAAPTIGSATLNTNGTVTVTWTTNDADPLHNISYTVKNGANSVCTATGKTKTSCSFAVSAAGLSTGGSYGFTVTANNAVGSTVSVAATSAITIGTSPTAPTNVTAAVNYATGKVLVSWTAPTSTGGTALTYAVSDYQGNVLTCTTVSATSCNVNFQTASHIDKLTNGTTDFQTLPYNNVFIVTATNANSTAGISYASSNVVSIAAVPVKATANTSAATSLYFSGSSLVATWNAVNASAPAPAATTYAVQLETCTTAATTSCTASGSPVYTPTLTYTFTKLAVATYYDVLVSAVAPAGQGPALDLGLNTTGAAAIKYTASAPATTGMVVSLTQTTNSSYSIAWTAPTNNNGSAVTGYVVTPYTCSAYNTVVGSCTAGTAVYLSATTLSYKVTGVSAGFVTATVAAQNASGAGGANAAGTPVQVSVNSSGASLAASNIYVGLALTAPTVTASGTSYKFTLAAVTEATQSNGLTASTEKYSIASFTVYDTTTGKVICTATAAVGSCTSTDSLALTSGDLFAAYDTDANGVSSANVTAIAAAANVAPTAGATPSVKIVYDNAGNALLTWTADVAADATHGYTGGYVVQAVGSDGTSFTTNVLPTTAGVLYNFALIPASKLTATSYTFYVTAVNPIGTKTVANASTAGTTYYVCGSADTCTVAATGAAAGTLESSAPKATAVTTTINSATSLTFSWTAANTSSTDSVSGVSFSSNPGYPAITGYIGTLYAETQQTRITCVTTGTSCTFAGLVEGQKYDFTLVTTTVLANANSAATTKVVGQPVGVPGAPTFTVSGANPSTGLVSGTEGVVKVTPPAAPGLLALNNTLVSTSGSGLTGTSGASTLTFNTDAVAAAAAAVTAGSLVTTDTAAVQLSVNSAIYSAAATANATPGTTATSVIKTACASAAAFAALSGNPTAQATAIALGTSVATLCAGLSAASYSAADLQTALGWASTWITQGSLGTNLSTLAIDGAAALAAVQVATTAGYYAQGLPLFAVGEAISGTGIQTGTYITAISGGTITLSNTLNAAVTGSTVITGSAYVVKFSDLATTGYGSVVYCTTVLTSLGGTCDVTGLTAGDIYTVTVKAVNPAGAGTSATSTFSTATVAGAPTAVTATIGALSNTVNLSWTAPVNTGGSAITSYTITAHTATGTAFTVDGATSAGHIASGGCIDALTSSTTITHTSAVCTLNAPNTGMYFTVSANTSVSSMSDAVQNMGTASITTGIAGKSNAVSNGVIASAPTAVYIAQTKTTPAVVTWTTTDTNGTGFTVEALGGSQGLVKVNVGPTVTSYTFGANDLTYGVSYTFAVIATNAFGSSTASAGIATPYAVTALNNPTAVTAYAATTAQAINPTGFIIKWIKGAAQSGLAITYQVVATYGGNVVFDTTTSSTSVSFPVAGLGTTTATSGYLFTVTATDGISTSPGVTIAGNAGSGVSQLNMTAPLAAAAVAVASTSTTATLTLTRVSAANAGGVDVTANTDLLYGQVWDIVTFTNAAGTNYTCYAGTNTIAEAYSGTTSCAIYGLTANTVYNYSVETYNVYGPSGTPTTGVVVTAPALASAPTGITVTAGVSATTGNSMTVTWTAPASNGGAPITGYIVGVEAASQAATVTAASAAAGTVTYTAANTFVAGEHVTISGLSTTAFNLSNVVIASASATGFTVTNAASGSAVTGASATAVVAGTTGAFDTPSFDTFCLSSALSTATSCTITGIAGNTSNEVPIAADVAYFVEVIALNAAGSSPAGTITDVYSVPQLTYSADGAVAPNGPTYVSATSTAVGSLVVSWTASAPSAYVALPVTGYLVYASGSLGDTVTCATTTTTCTLVGMSNASDTYTVGVYAQNAVSAVAATAAAQLGTAAASCSLTSTNCSAGVVTWSGWTAPTVAPVITTAVSLVSGTATVIFADPATTTQQGQGSAITGYTVTATDSTGAVVGTAGAATASTVVPGNKQVTITGLTSGSTYTISVVASNAVGASPAATISVKSLATANPSAVTGLTASRNATGLAVKWTAPASIGSAAQLVGYWVTATDPLSGQQYTCPYNSTYGVVLAPAVTCSIVGLTVGTVYNVSVTAIAVDGALNKLLSAATTATATYTTLAPEPVMATFLAVTAKQKSVSALSGAAKTALASLISSINDGAQITITGYGTTKAIALARANAAASYLFNNGAAVHVTVASVISKTVKTALVTVTSN